jgi:hypothetical protein
MNNNKSTQYDREKTTRFPWFPRITAMKFLDEPACRNVSEGFP